MSYEYGPSFGHANDPDNISPEDCTLALVAEATTTGDTSDLKPHIEEEDHLSATLSCKACHAILKLSNFSNVGDSSRCRALFRDESIDTIRQHTEGSGSSRDEN